MAVSLDFFSFIRLDKNKQDLEDILDHVFFIGDLVERDKMDKLLKKRLSKRDRSFKVTR